MIIVISFKTNFCGILIYDIFPVWGTRVGTSRSDYMFLNLNLFVKGTRVGTSRSDKMFLKLNLIV